MSLLGIFIVVAVGWVGLRVVAGRHRPSFGLGLKVLGVAAILGGLGLFWARIEIPELNDEWQEAKHEWQEAKRDLLDEADFSFNFDHDAMHREIHDDIIYRGPTIEHNKNLMWVVLGAKFAIAAVLVILGALLIGREKTRPVAFKFATLLGVGAVVYGVFAFLAAPPRSTAPARIIARHEAFDDRDSSSDHEIREPRTVKPPKHAKLPARVKHPDAPRHPEVPARPSKPSRPSRVKRPALRPERPSASQTGATQTSSSELVMPPRAGEIPVSAELAKQATAVEAATVKSEVANEVQPTPPPVVEAPAPVVTPAPVVENPTPAAAAAPPASPAENAPAAENAVPAASPVPTESPVPVETQAPVPAATPAVETPAAEPAASAEAVSAVTAPAPAEAPVAQPAPEAAPAAAPATAAPAAEAAPTPEPAKAVAAPVSATPVSVAQRPADAPASAEVPVPVDVPVKVQVNPIVESEAKLLSVPISIQATEPVPDWVTMKPHLVKSDYQLPVSSGLFVSVPECQRELDREMKRAADHYIDEYLGEQASGVVNIPLSYLKRHIKKQEFAQVVLSDSVGPMHQIHALLSFDDQARADFQRRWREAIVTNRLWYAGSGAGLVLALLGTLYGYLRLDHKTGGAHKGRLQLAATLVALVATAGVLVVRWAVPF